ncbi:PTS system protein [Klebsiella michiganensis]|uniref:PTS system protein n=1 Tax=Klebsiella michiganensis TaxID=1134687 RepID=A0A7H4PF82_9ENTR|nr:PTS system protein [Klebsiella michiganensis]
MLEREALKAAFPMGICMITEGVDPHRRPRSAARRGILRGGVSGGRWPDHDLGRGESGAARWGCLWCRFFTHPLLFCLSLAIGTVICGVMLSLWKKPVTERDEEFDELNDQKLKDDEITFTLE